MSDGRPHLEATDWTITGPTFPPGTDILYAELQLTACRLAAVVGLREPQVHSEYLAAWDWRTGEKYMVCFSF